MKYKYLYQCVYLSTYNGETHEASEQEEVVVQVTVIQVSGHPLVA